METAQLGILAEQVARQTRQLGRLEALQAVLEWAVKHKDEAPQPIWDSLNRLVNEVRQRA